jgi:hypothetical protein
MDDSCLRNQTSFGEKLLQVLSPLIASPEKRDLLLEEARSYAREALADEMQWRLASQHTPAVEFKARKNDLLNHQNPTCKNSMVPTLMQMVERYF